MEYNNDFERRRAYISSREKLRKRRRTVHITILLIVLGVLLLGIGGLLLFKKGGRLSTQLKNNTSESSVESDPSGDDKNDRFTCGERIRRRRFSGVTGSRRTGCRLQYRRYCPGWDFKQRSRKIRHLRLRCCHRDLKLQPGLRGEFRCEGASRRLRGDKIHTRPGGCKQDHPCVLPLPDHG